MNVNGLAHIDIETDGGPWALHNMPCAVCRCEPAVLVMETGVFYPCWQCQLTGWRLVNKNKAPWWKRWALKGLNR